MSMPQQRYLFVGCLALLVLLNTVATTWLPSLRLIVWAFFTGCAVSCVVLAAAVLFTSNVNTCTTSSAGSVAEEEDEDDNPLRRIKPLAIIASSTWKAETLALSAEDSYTRIPLFPPSFQISHALDNLLDLVNRDFVSSWYSKISPQSPSFSLQAENLIRHAVLEISRRIQAIDAPRLLVGRIVPLLTSHLHDFSAAERTVRGRHLNINLTESEELDLAIASKYRNGKLHVAAGLGFSDMKQAQQDHLRMLVDKILPMLLPSKEMKSRVVSIISREIIACAVLYPTLQMLSDPDTWNKIIEAIVSSPGVRRNMVAESA